MKQQVIAALNATGRFVRKPNVLTGVAIVGFVATCVTLVKATKDATEEIINVELKALNKGEEVEVDEAIRIVAPYYILPTVMGLVTIGAIVASNRSYARENAALAAALNISETALANISAKTVEQIGEKKFSKIKEEATKELVLKNPPVEKKIIRTGKGETLFYEPTSATYFRSDIETVRRALTQIKDDQLSDPFNMWVCLQDVYYALLIPDTSISRDLGWDYHKDGLFDYDLTHTHINHEGTEAAIVITYLTNPNHIDAIKRK